MTRKEKKKKKRWNCFRFHLWVSRRNKSNKMCARFTVNASEIFNFTSFLLALEWRISKLQLPSFEQHNLQYHHWRKVFSYCRWCVCIYFWGMLKSFAFDALSTDETRKNNTTLTRSLGTRLLYSHSACAMFCLFRRQATEQNSLSPLLCTKRTKNWCNEFV